MLKQHEVTTNQGYPITEPTMLWVAPGWRPPPYPQALAYALAAHAAHALSLIHI